MYDRIKGYDAWKTDVPDDEPAPVKCPNCKRTVKEVDDYFCYRCLEYVEVEDQE